MRAFLTCRLIRSLLNWACNKRYSSLSLTTNTIEKRCRYHSSSWVDLSRLSGFCVSFVCTSIFRYLLLMWMNYIQSYVNQTICKPQYNPGLNGHDIVHAVLWRLSNRQGEHCEGGFVQESQGVGMCGGGKETHRWITIKVLTHSYWPSEGGNFTHSSLSLSHLGNHVWLSHLLYILPLIPHSDHFPLDIWVLG